MSTWDKSIQSPEVSPDSFPMQRQAPWKIGVSDTPPPPSKEPILISPPWGPLPPMMRPLRSSAPDDASSEVTAPRCCRCSRSLGDAVDLDLRAAAAFFVNKVLVREFTTSKFLVVFLRKRSDFFIACAAEWATEDLVTLLVDGSQRIGGLGGGASSPALDELFGLSDGSSLASCGVSTSASSPGDDAAMVKFR